MAVAVERAWRHVAIEGVVITRYNHGAPTDRIRVIEAGHPVPDAAGEVRRATSCKSFRRCVVVSCF